MRSCLIPALLGALFVAAHAQAQQLPPTSAPQLIQGLVLNEDGQPLPGATILIKGTKTVYSTNADGVYTFQSAQAAPRVQIILLGYTEAELTVRPGSPNAVTLQILPGTRIKHGGRNNGKLLAVGKPQAD